MRRWAFLLACVVAVALPLLYAAVSHRLDVRRSAGETTPSLPLDRLAADRKGVLFRSTRPDASFGKLAFVPHDREDGRWLVSHLSCDRVYFQRGRGVCQVVDSALVPPYGVFVFDEHLAPASTRPLSGVPSRARVSPDGRRAALTVFETGHSYAQGSFSTRTTILDAATGELVGDLESFAVTRDAQPFKAVDFNFWGVTFAKDGNRFYATLRTGGVNYLVEGDVDRRTARVVHSGVECPSLSPDERRLAFKKRVSSSLTVFWQVAVLDLETMHETVLAAEQRSVDDQVDWLDNQHVVYHLPTSGGADIWALRIDGAEPPRLLIAGGYSPSVLR